MAISPHKEVNSCCINALVPFIKREFKLTQVEPFYLFTQQAENEEKEWRRGKLGCKGKFIWEMLRI